MKVVILVLGLVVAPNYQAQGIAGRLLNYFENLAKNQHRHGVTLTCRESLISFMKNMGIVMKVYQNHVMAVLNGITLLKNIKRMMRCKYGSCLCSRRVSMGC